MRSAFIITSEAWYARHAMTGWPTHQTDEVNLQFRPDESGGVEAEFNVRWYNLGTGTGSIPRVECFNDAWSFVFGPHLMSESLRSVLVQLHGLNPSVEEFTKMLKMAGWTDVTERRQS